MTAFLPAPEDSLPAPEDSYDERERALAKLDPAFAKCSLGFRGGLRFGHKPDTINTRALPAVVAELDVYRHAFEAGELSALLSVLTVCMREVLPLPTWAATALLDRLRDYEGGKAPSLDEVFGTPLPTTGIAAARTRRDWHLGCRLWGHVVYAQAHLGKTNFDDALVYAITAERGCVGKTKARQLVLKVEAVQSRHLGPRVAVFSQLRRRTRKT